MNKNIILSVTVLAGSLIISSCSRKVTLTKSQERTISPQAATYIKNLKTFSVPGFIKLKDKMALQGREQFNSSEKIVEDKIIAMYNLTVDSTVIAHVPVLIIRPAKVASGFEDVIAYNVHGGGFTMGTARDRSALMLAGEMGVVVYSLEYSVAPEAKFPVPINQCFDVYKELIKKHNPNRMFVTSSSAGGQIILATLLKAQEQSLPMPKAQVLYTPAADISGDGDSPVFNDGRDYTSSKLAIDGIKAWYLGGADAHDPKVSPIYATYKKGFPASIILSGTRDPLLSNTIRLDWKLRAAGVKSEVLIGENMWHGGLNWEIDLPERIAASKEVIKFITEQLSVK